MQHIQLRVSLSGRFLQCFKSLTSRWLTFGAGGVAAEEDMDEVVGNGLNLGDEQYKKRLS